MKLKDKDKNTISIIIPVYNNSNTITDTLDSITSQDLNITEIIIVNDNSTDDSLFKINKYIKKNTKTRTKWKLINNKKTKGLAGSYNEGINKSTSKIIVTMHADIITKSKKELRILTKPFELDNNIVATAHVVFHPLDIYLKYNFWQKCLFSRLLKKQYSGLDGKFDAYNRKALIQIGLFDNETFRTAGEDGDIINKLKKIGRIYQTNAGIIHIHNIDKSYSLLNLIKKQAQYSEAQGVLLRRYKTKHYKNIFDFIKTFFREILIISLLIPIINKLSMILIIVYSCLYTKNVYKYEYKNKRIFLLPFINIFLLFISLFYTTKGFFYGKTKI